MKQIDQIQFYFYNGSTFSGRFSYERVAGKNGTLAKITSHDKTSSFNLRLEGKCYFLDTFTYGTAQTKPYEPKKQLKTYFWAVIDIVNHSNKPFFGYSHQEPFYSNIFRGSTKPKQIGMKYYETHTNLPLCTASLLGISDGNNPKEKLRRYIYDIIYSAFSQDYIPE